MPIRGLVMLAVFVASLPICFLWPFYGILLWAVVSFLNPQSSLFYWAPAVSFPWAVVVAAPTLCGLPCFSRHWLQRLACREVFLIFVLWLWFTVTSFISTHNPLFLHHAQDTWDRWQFVSKVMLMTLVTIAIVDTFARLRILVIVMSSCFGLIVLKSLPFIVMSGGAVHIYGPRASMVGDNNDLGLALNMTLPLFFFLAQSEPARKMKWLFGLLFVVTIPAIFCTYSRGALIGLAAIFCLMLFKLKLKQKIVLAPVIILAVGGALMFAPEAWRERMNPSQGLDGSAHERLDSWTFSWNLANDNPVAGGGFSTFTPQLYVRYARNGAAALGPHSVYFEVLAEHGFVGLALYLTLVAFCFAKARRLVKYARINDDQTVINYANMFQFSLTGFLVSGVFLGRAYFDYFFSIVACVIILDRIAWSAWASSSQDETEEAGELVEDSRVLAAGTRIVHEG
jgi:probable O-glycosylation ligase (exosortase A-associated)